MDDFEAPNFSLGLDFESQGPSFSLGFDLDLDSDIPPVKCQSSDIIHIQDSQESSDREPQRPDLNPGPAAPQNLEDELLHCSNERESLPTLKRLRRGSPVNANANDFHTPAVKIQSSRFEADGTRIDYDDIEDFSTDDDFMTDNNKSLKTPQVRTSSSRKLSLSGRKVLTSSLSQAANLTPTIAGNNNLSIGRSGEKPTSMEKFRPFGKIRQLIGNFSDEEDSDMFCTSSVASGAGATLGVSNATTKSVCGNPTIFEVAKPFGRKDPHKHFNVIPNASLPSPAFDEFCDEYFSSPRPTNNVASSEGHDFVVDSSVPLSYQYFDNEDVRIQRLLRQRLRHFLPISAILQSEGQGAEQIEIDYLGQFGGSRDAKGSTGVSLQGQVQNSTKKKSASRRLTKRKRPTHHDNVNNNWTTTRNRICEPAAPRDAGKRRVSASGRWYTGQSGRKIYITKDGQEMTGKNAYLTYSKDTTKNPRKSKKRFKKKAAKKM
ncbi:hypothetical protein SUGI_0627500 [Cryptomeria japonica]|uniref:uncharacterized protein LOC131039245 n=1 Tax=Cryptomeria japonica TaxID=3369 RepID=UPI0024146CD4|nr:uncharacterized protein LOC131039245 [Cryptomeria japonica]XP_057827943.1 uncharacterized protein LOC131039245 [Cryptomeria japonica]GLJ31280.1 hypothetical protein SUGI_0627500 [Cryptomeria japonica]